MRQPSYVTPKRLLECLSKNGWFSREQGSRYQPWRVGVCVSGGPDSMALAYLLRHMPHPFAEGIKAFLPYALIIDHGARDESHQEALWVERQLQALNMETCVQKLHWHADVDPKSTKGFEMKARDKRYRGLINLAAKNKLYDLFTGHHKDDQVETIMLRLLRDRNLNPLSFRGMSMTSTVPTANETQASSTFSRSIRAPEFLDEQPVSMAVPRSESYTPGIRLHRPLLKYQKDELIATCEHFGIPYVQDKTNFNPQLTPRNAIRHVRAYHKLPKALSSEGLLNACSKANEIYWKMEKQAQVFLERILSLDLHSETGVLFLCLEALPPSMTNAELQGLSFFMQRVISIVSPLDEKLLPTMLNRDYVDQIHTLCMHGPSMKSNKPASVLYNQIICARVSNDQSSNAITLRFSRQPISSGNTSSLTQRFQHDTKPIGSGTGRDYSRWMLWDQRFWLRVNGELAVLNETIVRPYHPGDVSKVRQGLKQIDRLEAFEKMLSTYALGNIRFTLPVLLVSGEIVAFPTLGVSVIQSPQISWEVLYSRDPRATEFFFPDIEDGDEIVWSFRKTQHETQDEESRHIESSFSRS